MASNIGRGDGHGFNSRDFNDPERGPCCKDPSCEYGKQARAHDALVQALQQAIHHARKQGCDAEFVVENPMGSLRLRPYMQIQNWPDVGQLFLHCLDLCAFGLTRKKPTDMWTSLPDAPPGSTGSGRCEQRCKLGYISSTSGNYVHPEPFNQFRGPVCDRARMPSMLMRQVLEASLAGFRKRHPNRTPCVVDMFAGTCALAKAAIPMGIPCISVELKPPPAAS